MSSKMKQWVALTVVGVLAVLAAGWFLLVSPKRSEASQVRAEVTSQESTNSGLQTQLAMLKAQAKTLPQQQAKLALVAAKIPDNPALPGLIRALSTAADDAGVELVSLAPGAPTPVVAAAAAPTTGAPGTTGTTAARPAGAAPVGGTPARLSGSAPSTTFSAGVLTAIPLTINVVGGYFQVEQFFDKLEELTRAAKVTAFTMTPSTNPLKPQSGTGNLAETGKVLSANVTANVYMAVGRGTTTAAPAGPATLK
jgi:type IV pilus assembly protein PilO